MLDDLPPGAVEAFLQAAGPESGNSLLIAEIRQLGGALADPHPERAALSHLSGRFVVYTVGLALDAAVTTAAERDSARVLGAMASWADGRLVM